MKLFKAVNSYSKLQIESEPEIVRKGILIVDDSKFSRNILKDILKTEGYLIVGEAGDGLEAIAMARDKRPEYIFMDVEMPKLDGLGAISKILEIDSKIKIVMCTALGQKNIILEAAKAGAKDYIIKPYIKDNIINVLNEITDKNQKEGQVIPFKAGKNHHEDISYKPITEEDLQPNEEAEFQQPLPEEELLQTPTEGELQQPLAEEELLQPLENSGDYSVNESLDSSFDQESLQDSTQEEVLDSYLNDELQEKIHNEVKDEPEEASANEEISEELETVTVGVTEENLANEEISEEVETAAEGEAEEKLAIGELIEEAETVMEGEAEENLAIEELLEQVETAAERLEENLSTEEIPDDETVERAKFVIAVLNEENSEGEETEAEVKPEETIADADTLEVDSAAVEVKPEEDIKDEVTAEAETVSVEVESEEAIADADTLEAETVSVEVESEEAIAEEVTTEAETEAVEVESEEAIAEEATSKAGTASAEVDSEKAKPEKAELEEAIANDELPKNVDSLEKTNQDISSDSNCDTYTFLWNNRFDLLQKEVIPQNSVSQRVSFYEYAYLDTGKYDTFIKDNLQREIALGMMKAYMSLDNRLQQDDTATFELRTLTYAKENRFFISNVLEEGNDKFTEITIANEIKYNSFKPKQTSQEITVKTGFYQLISDFVNGKSGRVLR